MPETEPPFTKGRLKHPEDVDEDDIEKCDHDCPMCHDNNVFTDGWSQWCWTCNWREEA